MIYLLCVAGGAVVGFAGGIYFMAFALSSLLPGGES